MGERGEEAISEGGDGREGRGETGMNWGVEGEGMVKRGDGRKEWVISR